MKSQHLSISFPEFELMPQPFGWKVEYYDDKAHLTPRETAIRTKLTIQEDIAIKTIPYDLQLIDVNYKSQMIKAFYQAFGDSVEFCDWTKKEIRKHADRNINNYFAGVRGVPISQSVMVIEPDTRQLIGLALFLIHRKHYYELDLLLVNPNYQRQGLATAMVSYVTQQLHQMGVTELYSFYHICNELSQNWHQKFGFKEKCTASFVRLKYAWYRDEVWRLEKLGCVDSLSELIKERDFWHEKLQCDDLQQDFCWEDE